MKSCWSTIAALCISGLLLLQSTGVAAAIDPTTPNASIRNCLPTDYKPDQTLIYSHRSSIANAIGWINNPQSNNLCGGYYQEPFLNFSTMGLIQANDTDITADSGSFYKTGQSVIQGHVIVNQPNRQMTAQLAHVYRDADGKISKIDLYGQVHFREPGKLLIGKTAHFQPDDKTGTVSQALYRIAISNEQTQQDSIISLLGINGWGTASQIKRNKKGDYELENATYATCPPTTRAWQLSAKNIYLDKESGRGYAKNVVMRIKDVPVFYWPYYNFPIDNRRKSGFLMPYAGYGNNNGFDLAWPYYLNLAPNYDMILTPEVYSKRGLMIGDNFRYLTTRSSGKTKFTFLPNDKQFAKFKNGNDITHPGNNRGSFSWQDATQYNAHWSTAIDYTNVSDDYYLQDFSNNLAVTTQNQLLQQADANYTGENWTFLARVQRYQTLHPINQTVSDIYARLPQLALTGNYPRSLFGGDVQIAGEFDNFYWPAKTTQALPYGQRYNLNPQWRLPIKKIYGFITPGIGVQATHYSLSSQPLGLSENIDRAIPIISLDSGLYFDKNIHWQGQDYIQTLEPRVYYLMVPYHDQSDLPNFESGYYIFSYDQLFRNNRFSGIDRIGDANQVSVGLTTRFIDADSGIERLRASIGQIYYFRDRRVQLCQGIGCSDNTGTGLPPLGYLPRKNKTSPIASQLNYTITQHWSTTANLAWQPSNDLVDNGNLSLNYLPGNNTIFSVGYAFLHNGDASATRFGNVDNNLHQITVSYAWPLNPRWSSVGAVSYNISHDYPMTYFSGIQYNSCCWAVRAVAARTFSTFNNNRDPLFHNSFYLQFLFKGLGTVGANNPDSMINSYVPNYQDIFH